MACFCVSGRWPSRSDALIIAVRYGSSTSTSSFSRKVGKGSSVQDFVGDDKIAPRTKQYVHDKKCSRPTYKLWRSQNFLKGKLTARTDTAKFVVRNSSSSAVESSARRRPGSVQPTAMSFTLSRIPVQSGTARVKYTRALALVYSPCGRVSHAVVDLSVSKSIPLYTVWVYT